MSALSARRLAAEGFLLPQDAVFLIIQAAMSLIGMSCGIGFELAFVLPSLLWLHRRRRR